MAPPDPSVSLNSRASPSHRCRGARTPPIAHAPVHTRARFFSAARRRRLEPHSPLPRRLGNLTPFHMAPLRAPGAREPCARGRCKCHCIMTSAGSCRGQSEPWAGGRQEPTARKIPGRLDPPCVTQRNKADGTAKGQNVAGSQLRIRRERSGMAGLPAPGGKRLVDSWVLFRSRIRRARTLDSSPAAGDRNKGADVAVESPAPRSLSAHVGSAAAATRAWRFSVVAAASRASPNHWRLPDSNGPLNRSLGSVAGNRKAREESDAAARPGSSRAWRRSLPRT